MSSSPCLGSRLWILLIVAGGLGSLRAQATTYFVATNGANTNPGTSRAAPFHTIQQAATNMTAGDTCFIRAGVYHETLAPAGSGTTDAPLTFAAYSNEVVTLDAADVVTGWTLLSNGIYHASVNWDLGEGQNQVFVDGAMLPAAQSPHSGTGDVLHPATVSVTVDNINSNLITSPAWGGKPDNYWVGAWFWGGVGEAWTWQSARVLSSTGNTITVDPTTATGAWWFTGSGRGLLWGLGKFLDADNAWYLQTNLTGNTLYLRIADGGNPATHIVEMKRRNWCVDLTDRNSITVSGLNLWAGAVRFQGNDNVLQNCQAQFLSHFMIIRQGYFEDGGLTQGGGVVLNGSNNCVRGCTLFNTAGAGVTSSGSGNVITRNLIYNTDYSGTSAACLILQGAGEIVTFNTAHSSGRDILRPEGTGADIRGNDLSEPGLLCQDLGVIYVWGINARGASGPATRIADNWIHDNPLPQNSPLIYLDNYCANFVIDHNVCWNSAGDSGIQINGPAAGHLIYNNTLFNCADVGVGTYDCWPNSNPDPTAWPKNVYRYSATNNLFLATAPQAQLVDWLQADFRLQPNAPAIDAGVGLPGFTAGYLDRAPDLGAYEFGGLAWTAGVGSTMLAIITRSAQPGGGSTAGGGITAGGARVTISATPNPGYRFVNWTAGGTVVSTAASTTFTASSDLVLVANFSPPSPIITPAGGAFTNSVKITLSCTTAGATIRYTTNGADPTLRSTMATKTGITLTNSCTLKAVAFKPKLANSPVASAVFTIIPPPPVMITTTNLPAGKLKTNYREPLVATGGSPPYKWALAAGKLPAGLTLTVTTGALTGKPTQAGTFNITVKVTDAKKQTATKTLTLTVAN